MNFTSNKVNGAAWVKLHLLTHGVVIDSSVVARAKAGGLPRYAARKNFYNTPLWNNEHSQLPQELRVGGLIVGLNSYGHSPWKLTWRDKDDTLVLENVEAGEHIIPELIPDLSLFHTKPSCIENANLYGSAALAFFSPRNCYFFHDKVQCGFCSLAGTAEATKEFKNHLSEELVHSVVRDALLSDGDRIEQIMVVGGNMRDLDRGFRHHVALARAAASAVQEVENKRVSIHIATMPPRDLDLIKLLLEIPNVHVMFNLEVWDQGTFARVCPGKDRDYGRAAMLKALEYLRDTIGAYKAHSLLVTGLESAETTGAGALALAEMGVSPIINVYHSDRHSILGSGPRPTFKHLVSIANSLQKIHERFPIKPYWKNCGRNALDSEAKDALFRDPIPEYLLHEPDIRVSS